MNPGLCGEKLVTHCLSCDTLFLQVTALHGFSILHKIRSVHKIYVYVRLQSYHTTGTEVENRGFWEAILFVHIDIQNLHSL